MFTLKLAKDLFLNTSNAKNNDCDIAKSRSIFSSIIEDSENGFYKLIEDKSYLDKTKTIHQQFSNKSIFFHIGIGGSSLGPLMLVSALNKSHTTFHFINNIDADQLFDQLSLINSENIKDCLFYFVSKSGGTAETIGALSIITNYLKEKFNISKQDLANYFIFCTDPEDGDLRALAKTEHILSLEVPKNIGGRFSVLTHVGLLPAMFAKLDIEELWNGAKKCQDWITSNDQFFHSASSICQLQKNGVDQTVLMPYSSKLKEFSSWFVQLWAESLGKKNDLNGKVVHNGLTPIPAYGATDQHSQMQLFMEGPYNKLLILIEIENFKNDFKLNSNFKGKSFDRLNNHSLSQLYKAELYGTMKALEEAKRPYFNLKIDQLNESTIGSLIMYCQCLTALVGRLENINPFDQPGVEAGKIFAYKFLKQGL